MPNGRALSLHLSALFPAGYGLRKTLFYSALRQVRELPSKEAYQQPHKFLDCDLNFGGTSVDNLAWIAGAMSVIPSG